MCTFEGFDVICSLLITGLLRTLPDTYVQLEVKIWRNEHQSQITILKLRIIKKYFRFSAVRITGSRRELCRLRPA